jgi:hypothetical protein
MANSIALAKKYSPILDEIYKSASVTAILDSQTRPVENGGANEVLIFKTSMVGMGNYSKATGYPAGDITGTWETIQLTKDRGRAFSVDRMDNEESLGMAYGTLAGEYVRTQVAPEIDATRFAAWAGASGIQTVSEAALANAAAVLAAVDVAAAALDTEDVPMEGRVLFISSALYRLLNGSVSRSLTNEGEFNRLLSRLDDMNVIRVPQARFYTQVTLDAGGSSSAGGFSKTASTGRDINFMLMHPTAVWQAVKLNSLKVFSPEENQTSDGWLFQHRAYHDGGVYENKVKGVYLHKKNS